MSPSRRAHLSLSLAALVLSFSSALLAAPIRVTGRVQSERAGLSGVRVELFSAYESYAEAVRRLTEKTGPAPIAQARTDAEGGFEILAPENGCYRVVVQAEGYLAEEISLLPLVEEVELPPTLLRRSSPVEVRTVARWIEARDADSKPVAGVLARWNGGPVGITGPDGRLEIAVPDEEGILALESREGWGARIVEIEGKGILPVRLTPPKQVAGRVVDSLSREPVAGAVVWSGSPLVAPAVRSGADGRFVLEILVAAESWLEAAAAGFFPGERPRF